jgi:hypothetical protein
MSNWSAFDHGRSIGTLSIEGGTVLYDEEHESGARITLRRSNTYTSISLNIYGWMDHTRFFTIDTDAQREYRAMRSAVDELMEVINTDGVRDIKIWEAISDFVRRFP